MNTKLVKILMAVILIVSFLYGCQPAAPAAPAAPSEPTATTAAAAPAGEKMKVGLSFSDFATERWKNEEVLMRKLLEEKGYEVLSQEANHDVKLQNDQIDNMVGQGVKGLIVIAEDGDAVVTSVDKAADAGVKVIAYDRLIKTSKIAAYLSFDNVEVGRNQADGVMKAVDIENWDVAKKGKLRLIKMGGSPTDNNAHLVRQGQDEVLAKYADKIEVVADQWVNNWDAAEALKLMENMLTAAGNKVDAVVASNDGTALGALQAMKAQGLAGKVPISGQDATADGANSIVKGELTVSVFKDIRLLSPLAVDTLDTLLKGGSVSGMQPFKLSLLTGDDTKTGDVPCLFLEVKQVTKDNVYDLVVKSGFQPYDDVYRDIPDAQKPPKPGEAGVAAPAGEKMKVGLSFSDFATERWKNEEVLMRKLLEEKGYEVLSQEANHDVKLQNDQIDNMVGQGVKGLIVIAEDGDAVVTSVDKAADAGVKVIAYDRLIKTSKIAAYLSFDNVEVGRNQADGVMKAVDIENWDVAKKGKLRLIKMGGSPTDNNAHLVRQGQDEVLAKYADKIEVVADQWVNNWDAAEALKLMENMLTAAGNKVDAVVASNDGTALGALQAMKAQGLAGKVPISGQDATADGANSIVKGELTVSVFKDIRLLSPLAVDTLDTLLKGGSVSGMQPFKLSLLTGDDTKTGDVPCLFLEVKQVTKDNVYDLVVKSGFQPYDDVYRDIPDDKKPPKP
jgi:D-xylose transport system substrate-binding protein